MNNRIEQEIDKTLECFEADFDIQVNPLFADKLSSRISKIKVFGGTAYQSRIFYPVVIALLLILNFSTGFISFKGDMQLENASGNQTNTLAAEYGIGQNNNITF